MKRFRQFLEQKQDTIGVFGGRFQGLTKGHQKAIQSLKSKSKRVVILVILGEKTSKELKNFLNVQTRMEMIRAANHGVEVLMAKNGFLPGAIKFHKIWNIGDTEKILVASGDDRVEGFKKMFNNVPYEVEFLTDTKRTPGISGTDLRNSLTKNDFKAYKRISAKGVDTIFWFERLKKLWLEKQQ